LSLPLCSSLKLGTTTVAGSTGHLHCERLRYLTSVKNKGCGRFSWYVRCSCWHAVAVLCAENEGLDSFPWTLI